MVRIGACQTPEILGDVDAALRCIAGFAERAEDAGVDLLLFPECFLQGYGSGRFRAVAGRLARVRPTLVIGMIERFGDRLYNTAVALEGGEVRGRYRKTHLLPGESIFDAGDEYPVFDLDGVRYGINICHDTAYPEPAAAVARRGARVLLVPAQNMMRRAAAEHWRDRHNEIRAQRVRETGMWLVSADVTGTREETHIGYGPTSVMNPAAEVVAQVPLMTSGMVVAEIGRSGQEPLSNVTPRPPT